MSIEGISSIGEANEFLPGFIEKYNKQFAVEPADPESAFAEPMAKGRAHSHWLNHLLLWPKVPVS